MLMIWPMTQFEVYFDLICCGFGVGLGASFFILFSWLLTDGMKTVSDHPGTSVQCPIDLSPLILTATVSRHVKKRKKAKRGKKRAVAAKPFSFTWARPLGQTEPNCIMYIFVYWPNWTLLNPTITSNTSRPWRSCGGSFSASCKLDPLCHGCIVSIVLYWIVLHCIVMYRHFVTVVFILSEGLWSDAQIPARCSSNNRGCINVYSTYTVYCINVHSTRLHSHIAG